MLLKEDERARVHAAVVKAEAGLAAEIVTCVFAQSSPYPETIWAGAAAAVGLACGALFLIDMVRPVWLPLSTLMLIVPATGLAGAALGRWFRPLKRMLIGQHHMAESAARRAKEIFFDRGIARTRSRDGVLIFASLLERRVIVLADDAIRAQVKAEAWEPAIAALTAFAADGRVADGLIAAVEKAGAALRAAGVVGQGGGELDDETIEGDGR